MNETFFNIDFFRTLLSVLTGGIISLGSVLIIENLNKRKELQEKKRRIYNGLILTINSIRRNEINSLQHSIGFNYQKQIYSFDKDEKSKQQAEYHQINQDKGISNLIEKSEQLDLYMIDYKIYIGEDNAFDNQMAELHNWPRPKRPDYSKIKNVEELNNKMNSDMSEITEFIENYWKTEVNILANHLNEKLL